MKRFSFFQLMVAMVVMLMVPAQCAKAETRNVKIDGIFYEFIGDEAFVSCSNISIFLGEYEYASGSYSGDVAIPKEVIYEGKTYPVVGIIHEAFRECTLSTVTLPESLREIRADAFWGATIERLVFSSWEWWGNLNETLRSDIIGPSDNPLEKSSEICVGGELFDIENLVLPEGVTRVNNFWDCRKMKSIIIPSSAKLIARGAFRECYNLGYLKMGANVKVIEGGLGESALKTIDIGDIANWCGISLPQGSNLLPPALTESHPLIVNGEEVVDLVIPEGVRVINPKVFSYCTNLKSLTLPQSIDSVCSESFKYCKSLEGAVNLSGASYIGNEAFAYSGSFTSVTLGENLEHVGNKAFRGCHLKGDVVFHDKVKEIGSDAFADCDLNSIVIGSGVEKIGSGAFSGCESIQTVTSHIVMPFDLPSSVFPTSVQRNAILYVPAGTKELYTRFDGWRSFINIVEQEDSGEGTCLLALQDAFGAMKLQMKRSEQQTLFFQAAKGWKVHSVSYNGIDVTAQLGVDGSFTTPALFADATINVVYEEITPNAIASAEPAAVHVSPAQGGIMVGGAKAGSPCSVYTFDGRLAARQTISSADSEYFALPSGQVYVVQVGAKRLKVLVP